MADSLAAGQRILIFPMTDLLSEIQEHAEKLSLIGLLAIMVVTMAIAFFREWIVTGKQFRAVRADRDLYRDLFFQQVGVNNDAIVLARKLTADASKETSRA